MASTEHEFILVLFDELPSLLRALTPQGETLGVGGVEVVASDLTQSKALHLLADRCFVFRSDEGQAELVVVLEVQRDIDESKAYSWPAYAATAALAHRCPASVVVVAPTERVAGWARTPSSALVGVGWCPHVIGPTDVAQLATAWAGRGVLQLDVLALVVGAPVAHPDDLVRSVFARLWALDSDRFRLYLDVVMASLSNALLMVAEDYMNTQKVQYKSDFAIRHYTQGLEEGLEEGREEARELLLRLAGASLPSAEVAELAKIQDVVALTAAIEARLRG